MQITEELVRNIVQEVLARVQPMEARNGKPKAAWGVFDNVDAAVAAAQAAQRQFEQLGLEGGARPSPAFARSASNKAEMLGLEELEETRIGRLKHKVEKLIIAGQQIPGVEFLRTEAFSGENGVTLQEFAPFGVIGIITPVTHSLPTLACNAISMLAAGNALVCNPHPSGARVACQGRAALQSGDPRSDRHRQPDHDHRQADAGIGPGDLRSSRRSAVVRHGRPGCGPSGVAESQAGHRRRAGQSAGGRG